MKAFDPKARSHLSFPLLPAECVHAPTSAFPSCLLRPCAPQVVIERESGASSTQLDGPEYMDVPALSSKDYKLSVLCYTSAPTAAKVTFRNEASGEYSFYNLRYAKVLCSLHVCFPTMGADFANVRATLPYNGECPMKSAL